MSTQLMKPTALDTAEFSAMIKMVAGEKGEMLAIVPGDPAAPIPARAAALVMSNLMGLGAKGYQVYQVQGRWVVEPTYKAMVTMAQRIAPFRMQYEPANVSDQLPSEQLENNPAAMAVVCKIFRNDEMREVIKMRKDAIAVGVPVEDLDKIGLAIAPTAQAVGIFYGKRMRKYKNGAWQSDNLPNTWTPEDQAKKRALKKALRLAFGEIAVPPAVTISENGPLPEVEIEGGSQLALPVPSKYPPEITMDVMLEWGERWQMLDEEQREYLFEKKMRSIEDEKRRAKMSPEEKKAEADKARADLGGNRKKRLGEPILVDAEPEYTSDTTEKFEKEFREETEKNIAASEPMITKAQLKALHAYGHQFYGDEWDAKRHGVLKHYGLASSKDLTREQTSGWIDMLVDKINQRAAAEAVSGMKFNDAGADAMEAALAEAAGAASEAAQTAEAAERFS